MHSWLLLFFNLLLLLSTFQLVCAPVWQQYLELVKRCQTLFTERVHEFWAAVWFSLFVPCVVNEYSRKHVLFAQMVGEWHFPYEYILMQTDIPGGARVFTNSPLTPCLKSLGHLVRNQEHWPDSINQLHATTHKQQTVKKEQNSAMACIDLSKMLMWKKKSKPFVSRIRVNSDY